MSQTSDSTLLALDEAARSRAIDPTCSALLSAPAGSGKTGLLILRLLACLLTCDRPEEALAITFTNKAAQEMRKRTLEALIGAEGEPPTDPFELQRYELASKVLERSAQLGWDLVRNPSRIKAITMDSLNRMIINATPITTGLGGNVPVTDRPEILYRAAVQSLIDSVGTLPDSDDLVAAIARVLALGRNQTAIVTDFLCDLLARRDQWLGLVVGDADQIAAEMPTALTQQIESRMARFLSDQARGDLDAVVRALGGGQKAGILADAAEWPAASVGQLPIWRAAAESLLTGTNTLRKSFDVRAGFPAKTPQADAIRKSISEWHASIDGDAAAADLLFFKAAPNPLSMDELSLADTKAIALVLRELATEHLQAAFDKAGQIDFCEVSLRALAVLTTTNGAVMRRIDGEVRHLLVDEVQDTSALQYALLQSLISEWQPGDGHSLFMVGDAQQSIYLFRQADVSLFLRVWEQRALGHFPLETLNLTRNFRSDGSVVRWFNGCFESVFPRRANLETGAVSFLPSVPARPEAGGGVHLEWVDGASPDAEAEQVLALINDYRRSKPGTRQAVLVRNRSHAENLIEKLRERGIPFASQDIDALSSTDAVKDSVALIKAIWHPLDRVSWAGVLRAPFVGLDWADMTALLESAPAGSIEARLRRLREGEISSPGQRRVINLLEALDQAPGPSQASIADRAEWVWHRLGGARCVNASGREDALKAFNLARGLLAQDPNTDIEDFDQALAKLFATAGTAEIEILTMHRSKGLEYDVVYLVGLHRRSRPADRPALVYRKTNQAVLVCGAGGADGSEQDRLYSYVRDLNQSAEDEEVNRLLYVAITRAKTHLHIVVPVTENRDGDLRPADAGALLAALWPAIAADVPVEVAKVAGRATEDGFFLPFLQRLSDSAAAPELARFIPSASSLIRPSEQSVAESDETQRLQTVSREQLVGTLFHETVDFLIRKKVTGAIAPDLRARLSRSLRAGFRRLALPEPEVPAAVEQVLTMIDLMISIPVGTEILAPNDNSWAEFRMSGLIEGSWVSATLDRIVLEPDLVRVIDYKTGGFGVDDRAWAAYREECRFEYAQAMSTYALLAAKHFKKPVRKELYLAARGECLVL